MFSPMSSFVLYPAITSVAHGLGVTVELINLAVTTYMVVLGLAPALLGTAADKFGRRPIYLLALSTCFAANLGLTLQNTYAGLLVLRMIQSAGSSGRLFFSRRTGSVSSLPSLIKRCVVGTIALGYGVISDITTRAERGFHVRILILGYVLLSSMLWCPKTCSS